MKRLQSGLIAYVLIALAIDHLQAAEARSAPTIEVDFHIDGSGSGLLLVAVDGQGETWNSGADDKGLATVIKESPGHFAVHIQGTFHHQADTIVVNRTFPVASFEPKGPNDKGWTHIALDFKIAAYFNGSTTSY